MRQSMCWRGCWQKKNTAYWERKRPARVQQVIPEVSHVWIRRSSVRPRGIQSWCAASCRGLCGATLRCLCSNRRYTSQNHPPETAADVHLTSAAVSSWSLDPTLDTSISEDSPGSLVLLVLKMPHRRAKCVFYDVFVTLHRVRKTWQPLMLVWIISFILSVLLQTEFWEAIGC